MEGQGQRHSSRQQFGPRAATYAVSWSHSAGESLELVEAMVARDGRSFLRAVDVATGAGFTAFVLAPHADRVLATDLTPQMLEQAKRLRDERGLANVELALAAAEGLPFASDSLDLVTCRIAPHHFLGFHAWLAEVRRVLRPGGLLVACDTAAPEDEGLAEWMNGVEVRRDPSHVRNRAPSEWHQAVEDVGLRVTHTELCYTWHEFEDWTKRAGMASDERERLRADFLGADTGQANAFNLKVDGMGTIRWSWDAVVLRAVKSS